MKHKYQKPQIEVITMRVEESLLTSNSKLIRTVGDGARYWKGTVPTGGQTWGIVDAPAEIKFDHGQGAGGSGNRAPYNPWTAWDE